MTRLFALALAALALCPVLAACGEDDGSPADRLSAADYRARLAALERRDVEAQADLQTGFTATSVTEIQERISRFADEQKRFGDDVAKLKPPKDAEAANARLANGARDFAAQIRAAAAELSGTQTLQAAVNLLSRRLREAKGAQERGAALAELNRKGYTKSGASN